MKSLLSVLLSAQLMLLPLMLPHTSLAQMSYGSPLQCRGLFSSASMEQVDGVAKTLGLKTARAFLTFPLPVLPLARAVKDKDKRWAIFEKSVLIGPVTTAVAVSISRMLTGSETPWVNNFIDSYVSYTGKDTIAMGVALDNKLKSWQRYWINYGYTVGAYAAVTTLTSGTMRPIYDVLTRPELASVADVQAASYGLGLVTFAFAWPLVSQVINTTMVPPILAYRFPTKTTLDAAKSSEPTIQLLSRLESQWKQQSDEKLKKQARDQYLWAKWIRTGLEPGDKYPFLPMTVKKQTGKLNPDLGVYAIKTFFVSVVATSMIVAYFGARDLTIGTSPQDMQLISEVLYQWMMSPQFAESLP